jgi:hypothetical protein
MFVGGGNAARMADVDRNQMRETEEAFAQANAKIGDAAARLEVDPVPFFCECSATNCRELIYIPLADYQTARQTGGFMLSPGHDDPHVEHVIGDFGSYIVVEKFR